MGTMVLLWLVLASSTSASDRSIHLRDTAAEAGLSEPLVYGGVEKQKYILETTGSGVAVFDYDKDNRPDIFLVNGTRLNPSGEIPSNLLYRNVGGGKFQNVTASAELRKSGWGQGVCIGDVDNDGWTDLFVTYYGKSALYRNRGNRTFEDISDAAGLVDSPRWNSGCTFVDYDRDGDLDLFVANYVAFEEANKYEPGSGPNCMWRGMAVMCGPMGLKTSANILYQNNGEGTFKDVSSSSGITNTAGFYSLMPVTLDFDGDGWTDLFVACDSAPNVLYHNNGDGTFTDVGFVSGTAVNEDGQEQAGMGVAAGDYNLDGRTDLLVTNFSDETSTLYRNDSGGVFIDSTYTAKLGYDTMYLSWGTGLVDLDNDGWKDIFIVNGHVYPEVDQHPSEITYRQSRLVYRNLRNGTFENISAKAGPGVAERRASRGAAFADLDGDGDLDVVITNLNDIPSLLRSESVSGNNWLAVRLEGVRSNRSGIGARVQIESGGRVQTDEVRSASSYYSSNGLAVHFGLGSSEQADRLEILWPSGTQQSFDNVQAGRVITVHESEGIR